MEPGLFFLENVICAWLLQLRFTSLTRIDRIFNSFGADNNNNKIYSQILKHESTFIDEKETQHVNRYM